MMKFRQIFIFLSVLITIINCSGCETKSQQQQSEKKEIFIDGSIANKPDDLLILDSDLIITGTVKEIGKSKWSNPNFEKGKEIRNIIRTDIYVEVDNFIYGKSSTNTVAVRINKGEDETTIVHSEGYPDFTVGEKVLLFLARERGDVATDEDYYILVGMNQGKYNLEDSGKAEGANMKDSADGAKYVNLEYPTENRTFEIGALKQQIKEEHEKRPNYREERAQKEAEIEERNKELFGE